MKPAMLQTLVQLSKSLAGDADSGHPSDGELLSRFCRLRDEAAFAAILERRARLVWNICRSLLPNDADAEDAFQATFIALFQSAGRIRKTQSLAPWLHGVATRIAKKIRLTAARRGDRERRVAKPESASVVLSDEKWDALNLAIHDEIARLPRILREAFVLCVLEGHRHEEAAATLGVPVGTLSARVSRGRQKLLNRLMARGLTSAIAAAAIAVDAATTPAAAPESLLILVRKLNAEAFKTVAPRILGLALAANGGMPMKAKLMLAMLVVAGALGASTGLVLGNPQKKPTGESSPAKELKPAATTEAPPAAAGTVRVRVRDPQGKPLPGAKILASIWTNEKGFKKTRDYEVDAAGVTQVEIPKTYTIVRLWAFKKPFVTMFASWEQNELAGGHGLPAEYTFQLETGVAAGGRIVDEQGKPIAGVTVEVMLASAGANARPAHGDGRVRYNTWLAEGADAATTDSNGRWRIANVPNNPRIQLALLVSHPDFGSDERWQESQKAAGITTAMLLSETATLTLKRGIAVQGRVTDPNGKPVKDAIVVLGDNPYFSTKPKKFVSDAGGRYRLPPQFPKQITLTVIAPDFAPQLRKVNLQSEKGSQDFHMAPGKPMRLVVVNAAGKPIPNAYVTLRQWKGSQSIESTHNPNHPKVPDTGIPRRTNQEGFWEWANAPSDPVKLTVSAAGFGVSELEMSGGDSLRTVKLKSVHQITGRVTDAVTGKPIAEFTVIPIDVFRKDFLSAERGNAVAGKDGKLAFTADRTDIPLRLRVEAVGYRVHDGPEFRVGDDTSLSQNFRLQPSLPRTGLVLDATGKPVANAEVLLATPTQEARLSNGWGNQKATTDAVGRFQFPDPGERWAIVVRSNAGVAFADFSANEHDAGKLRLQPWASVRGRFSDGGKPVSGTTILLQPIRIESLDRPRINAMQQIQTDSQGRFEFTRVPPGPISVWVLLGPWQDPGFRSGPHLPLNLKPGQHVELDLGHGGCTVTGKVKLAGKVPADLDCTYSLNKLVRLEPGIAPPAEIARLGFDIRKGWSEKWTKSREALAYVDTLRSWFVKLSPDGSFRISGVPPGEYDLAIEIYAKPSGCLVDPLATKTVRVEVSEEDARRGSLSLPEIPATVVPVPAVGDVPSLEFKFADGATGKLAEFRGKYTLVHFWASWCGPCKEKMPALRKLNERFAGKGLVTLGLSLDDDAKAWEEVLKKLDLPWKQARLDGDGISGVSSVPAYWLLDSDGKIVAKVYDPDEVAAMLAERLK